MRVRLRINRMLHYGSMSGMVSVILWAILGVSFAVGLIFFILLRLMRSDHQVLSWRTIVISLLSFWLIWSTFSANSTVGDFVFPPPKIVFNAPDGFKGPWVVLIEDANAVQRMNGAKTFPFMRGINTININDSGVAYVQGLKHAVRSQAYLFKHDYALREKSTAQRFSEKFAAYGFGSSSALKADGIHLKKEEFVEWALSKNADSTLEN